MIELCINDDSSIDQTTPSLTLSLRKYIMRNINSIPKYVVSERLEQNGDKFFDTVCHIENIPFIGRGVSTILQESVEMAAADQLQFFHKLYRCVTGQFTEDAASDNLHHENESDCHFEEVLRIPHLPTSKASPDLAFKFYPYSTPIPYSFIEFSYDFASQPLPGVYTCNSMLDLTKTFCSSEVHDLSYSFHIIGYGKSKIKKSAEELAYLDLLEQLNQFQPSASFSFIIEQANNANSLEQPIAHQSDDQSQYLTDIPSSLVLSDWILNPKGRIIEKAAKLGLKPWFDTRMNGPPHQPTFYSHVTIKIDGLGEMIGKGCAASKKRAEMLASVDIIWKLSKIRKDNKGLTKEAVDSVQKNNMDEKSNQENICPASEEFFKDIPKEHALVPDLAFVHYYLAAYPNRCRISLKFTKSGASHSPTWTASIVRTPSETLNIDYTFSNVDDPSVFDQLNSSSPAMRQALVDCLIKLVSRLKQADTVLFKKFGLNKGESFSTEVNGHLICQRKARKSIFANNPSTSSLPRIYDFYFSHRLSESFISLIKRLISMKILNSTENSFGELLHPLDDKFSCHNFCSESNKEYLVMRSREMLSNLEAFRMTMESMNIQAEQNRLSVYRHRQDILSALYEKDSSVLILESQTGSGKTTQVPQFILDHQIEAIAGAFCNIVVTEPRRIAAISMAKRVAFERGEDLGTSIGYQVRYQKALPREGGSITFCTTAILLRRISSDLHLSNISHIIVDEVHERDVEIDLLLIALRNILRQRSNVKVIFMSASLDKQLFMDYFEEFSPIYLNLPVEMVEVKYHFLEDFLPLLEGGGYHELLNTDESLKFLNTERSFLEELALMENNNGSFFSQDLNYPNSPSVKSFRKTALSSKKPQPYLSYPCDLMEALIGYVCQYFDKAGEQLHDSILVFLPGASEIDLLYSRLLEVDSLSVGYSNCENYLLARLHSTAWIEDHDLIFNSALPSSADRRIGQNLSGRSPRKIILATNIAETSLTIKGVGCVIDSAKVKLNIYDPNRRIYDFRSHWISRENCIQRAGRAGRCFGRKQGLYFCIMSQHRYPTLHSKPLAEIHRCDLQEVCLRIKSFKLDGSIQDTLMQAIEPPESQKIALAIEHLKNIQALKEETDDEITPLGLVLSILPISPSLGRMLVNGVVFRCLDPILTIVACISTGSPFIVRHGVEIDDSNSASRFDVKMIWGQIHEESDHIMSHLAYRSWFLERRQFKNSSDELNFCLNRGLSRNALHRIYEMKRHLYRSLDNFINLTGWVESIYCDHPYSSPLDLFTSGDPAFPIRDDSLYDPFGTAPISEVSQLDSHDASIFKNERTFEFYEYGRNLLNMNSANVHLTRAIVFSGCYPNIAFMDTNDERVFHTRDREFTLLHPSSFFYGSKQSQTAPDDNISDGNANLKNGKPSNLDDTMESSIKSDFAFRIFTFQERVRNERNVYLKGITKTDSVPLILFGKCRPFPAAHPDLFSSSKGASGRDAAVTNSSFKIDQAAYFSILSATPSELPRLIVAAGGYTKVPITQIVIQSWIHFNEHAQALASIMELKSYLDFVIQTICYDSVAHYYSDRVETNRKVNELGSLEKYLSEDALKESRSPSDEAHSYHSEWMTPDHNVFRTGLLSPSVKRIVLDTSIALITLSPRHVFTRELI